MRITRESLLQAARSAADQQLRKNRRMVCIYLTGSLLTDEPLLGHTTDIDLFFIHDSTPEYPREIVKLSDEIHLDIANFSQSDFRQPREQRTDPWLSPFICNNPIILHDTQHWFEFTQASICAQYGRPEYALQRARNMCSSSRQIWFDLKQGGEASHPGQVCACLSGLEKAANAVASLSSRPMTERRFLTQYPSRAEEVGRPELATEFNQIFASDALASGIPAGWVENWEAAFRAAAKLPNPPVKLDINRLAYYQGAVQAFSSQNPAAALWPVFRTWSLGASVLSDSVLVQEQWQTAAETLGFGKDRMDDKIHSLDEYLDRVEETIDGWAVDMGINS